MRCHFFPLLATSLLSLCTARADASYVLQDIVDPLNPGFTQALGINNSGTIVGYGGSPQFNGFEVPWPYGAADFVRENFPGTVGTRVAGISGSGMTVGTSVSGGSSGAVNGFAKSSGTFRSIDSPGAASSELLAINGSGTMAVGYSSTDASGATLQRAMTVGGGPSLSSPDFNDIDGLLPIHQESQATGVNDAGAVVGFYVDAAGSSTGFMDVGTIITTLMFPGAVSTLAWGINDLGQVVGDYFGPAGGAYAFIEDGGVFTSLGAFGSTDTVARGINDSGQIVGYYVGANGKTMGFLAQHQVPEPATTGLASLSLFCLAVVRRRSAAPSGRARPRTAHA